MATSEKNITERLAKKLLGDGEEFAQKQIEAKLALERNNWEEGISRALNGLELLNKKTEELSESEMRIKGELCNCLAVGLYRTERLNEALMYGKQAVDLGRQLYESTNLLFIGYLENLGNICKSVGKNKDAINYYLEVIFALEKNKEENAAQLSLILYSTSLLFYNEDDPVQARPLLVEAIPHFKSMWEVKSDEKSFQNFSNCLFLLGLVCISKKIQEYEQGLDALQMLKTMCEEYVDWQIKKPGFIDQIIQGAIRAFINFNQKKGNN